MLEELQHNNSEREYGRKNTKLSIATAGADIKSLTIHQHYYPEGAWGWVIVSLNIISNIITTGFQLSFGIFLIHLSKQQFAQDKLWEAVWLGSLSLSVSLFISPIVLSWCRRNSPRLAAIIGGLITTLGCLFASFSSQFHQLVMSYGIFLAFGIGIVREASDIMVGQYFKRRRPLVEIYVQSSIGAGIVIMTPFINWCFSVRHWRSGLQLITCVLFTTFIMALFYRPASLYHPQRRAILHLKIQRRKIKEKNPVVNKPPFFDFTPLKDRPLQILMLSASLFSFGFLSPLFFLRTSSSQKIDANSFSIISKQTLKLQIYFGMGFMVGVMLVGLITVHHRRQSPWRINRLNLCRVVMIACALLLITPIFLRDYSYGHILFSIFYGLVIGAFFYTYKMLLLERVRAKTFDKAWAFVQWTFALPILVGIPITDYLNSLSITYNFGFAFSSVCCLLACFFLFALSSELDNISSPNREVCHQQSTEMNSMDHNGRHNRNIYSFSSDKGDSQVFQSDICCNCGTKLSTSIKEQNSEHSNKDKDNDNILLSPKKQPAKDVETGGYEEEDEEFIFNKFKTQASELATYISDDLYNCLQNEEYQYEDDYIQENQLCCAINENEVRDNKICPIDECDDNENDNENDNNHNHNDGQTSCSLHEKNHDLVCDISANKLMNVKRTIDTVDEEPSNC